MVSIEPYSDRYFLDVMDLIKNFHKEAVSEYDSQFDPEVLIETIKTQNPYNAFLLVVDYKCQGILFGTRVKSMINSSDIFQEIAWYVNEKFRRYGVKLLKEAEKILKSRGVSIIIMAVLENSKTQKLKSFYERVGYKPMETHFVKNLTGVN